jgi:hypothetical protein
MAARSVKLSCTITAVFDGTVLRPETPAGLTPNARYVLTVEPASTAQEVRDAWDALDELSGTVDAPADWSREHDHYLYGVPKRRATTVP